MAIFNFLPADFKIQKSTIRWIIFQTSYAAQASIYGKRDGVLNGVAVISGMEKHNTIKQTRGWKQGVIHGINMLPRGQMFKPDSAPCSC